MQIETLDSFQPTELGGGKWQIKCYISDSLIIYIQIYLPPNFPQDRPDISVTPPGLVHDLIDAGSGRIRHQYLADWTPSMMLGKILEDIVLAFSLNPPVINNVCSVIWMSS